MHTTRRILVTLALLVVAQACFAQSTLTVRVTDFPPQYYQDETGRWTGVDVEMARALVEEAGFSVRFVREPWERALKDLRSGEIDLMTTLAKTAEREAFVHYIGLERYSEMVLVVGKSHSDLVIEGMDDLVNTCQKAGRRWGIQGGIYYSDEFNQRIKTDEEFSDCFYRVARVELLFRMVEHGRLLGFFEDALSLRHAIQTKPRYRRALVIHDYVLYRQPVYFGASKNLDATILKELENAHARLEAEGRFQEIMERDWPGADARPRVPDHP